MCGRDAWAEATLARIRIELDAAIAEFLILAEVAARAEVLMCGGEAALDAPPRLDAPGSREELLLLRRERLYALKAETFDRFRLALAMPESGARALDAINRSFAEAIDGLPEPS